MADPVVEDPKVVGESQEGTPGDKHPETVPWSQYVGIKEKFTRVEKELGDKITGLEEQAKKAVSTDEHTKIKEELESTKTKLQETSDVLKTTQEKTLTEKRDILVKRGVPEDKVKDLSEKELDSVGVVLETLKPKADLGGGGGGESPAGAKGKMQTGFEILHPSK